MSVSKSQTWLLVSVAVLAVLGGLFAPAAGVLNSWQVVPGGGLQLGIVVLISAIAPWVAVRIGRGTGTSGPVTVLLATAAGGLAAALVSPYLGALWGLFVAVIFVYPESRITRLLLRVLRWVLAFAIGVAGIALSRRLYIDGGAWRWACVLVILATVLLQLVFLRASLFRRCLSRLVSYKIEPPTANARSAWAAWVTRGVWFAMLITLLLSWKVGWHTEMSRRVRTITKKGGGVHFDRSALLTAVWKSASDGDWQFRAVNSLTYDPQWLTVEADWLRDLLWGPPARMVTLRDPAPQEIRTLGRLYGIRRLGILGSGVDDAMLGELPPLVDVTDLSIKYTGVTGAFLGESNSLRNVAAVEIEESPFADLGLEHLDQRLNPGRSLANLRVFGTEVTPGGIQALIERATREPIWPLLETDVAFETDEQLLKRLLDHPDRNGRKWAVGRLAGMDPWIATPLLIGALEDSDGSPRGVRMSAVYGLSGIGSALTTPEELVRTIERAFEPLTGPDKDAVPGNKSLIQVLFTGIQIHRQLRFDELSIDERLALLIKALRYGNRDWALERVVEIDAPTSVPPLIVALDEPHHSYAVRTLMRIAALPTTSPELFQQIERAWNKRLEDPEVNARGRRRIQQELSEMREVRARFEVPASP